MSLFRALTLGEGGMFPGGSFSNVRFVGSSPADRKEEVSVLGDSNEGVDVEGCDVVEEVLEELE